MRAGRVGTAVVLLAGLLFSGRCGHAQTDLVVGPATVSSGSAGYSATNSVTNGGNSFVVNGSAAVTFTAGGVIKLEPGFHATAGNAGRTFHAVIGAVSNSQAISFPAIPSQIVGSSFFLSASATSGLGVTFASSTPGVCAVTGNSVSLLAAGTCTIQASQAGNATYASAPFVYQSFTVNAIGIAPSGAVPGTPSQEYIYFGGQAVAIERQH